MTAGRARRAGVWAVLAALLAVAPRVGAAEVRVEIEGVGGQELANVRAFLGIAGYEFAGDEPDPGKLRRLHQRAPAQIRQALEPFGHYEATVRARLERTDDGWLASYRVEPGPRIRVVEAVVRAAGDAADDDAFEEVIADLPLQVGQPLAHPDYEAAKQRLLELASRRGYLEARWRRAELRIDVEAGTARAELVLDSGPRYRFGAVEFSASPLDEDFLRRYMRFRTGEPFDGARLLDLQYALEDSGYFRRVDVRARRDAAADGRIPVEVELEARPKHRYSFGIGYGTDTGPRFTFGRETRYANRNGHSLQTELEVAEVRNRFAARYTIPLAEPWREQLILSTSLSEEDYGDGQARQFAVEARRNTTSGGWQRSYWLEYERNRDEVGGEINERDLVMPGVGFRRSRFDDTVYATRGYRISADLNGGTETFGSDVSFLRTTLGLRGVRRLWPGGRVLGRIDLGRVWVDDFAELPLSQRFYAGGDQSVRGFDYQELGPVDEDGRVVGGAVLAVSSVELEQLLFGNWGAAVFVDHGNALAEAGGDLRTSVGLGLRYRSPVGVFRVDVAQPVDGDESPRLHLSLGVDL